jgi:YebC/PmpR family DNA-binding regulatory protein
MGRAFEYRRASKEKRWGKMSKLFPRLATAITVAVKAGSEDPDMNPKLRSAIMNAKAENMPKDNIEAAIKRALGKDAEVINEVNYEGKGPHGVLLFVECATDNNTRTVANVKACFNKNGGQVLTNGSLDFMFSRKAVFEFNKTDDMDLEELELELIDAGLEEIEEEDNKIFIYGDYINFGSLSKALDDLKIEVSKANLQRIPNNPIEFDEKQLIEIEKLIDKLEDDEDVQKVFTNIA